MESMGIFDAANEEAEELNQSHPQLLHAQRVRDGSRNFLRPESQIPPPKANELTILEAEFWNPMALGGMAALDDVFSAIPDYAPPLLPAIWDGATCKSYFVAPPLPAGLDRQQCHDYQISTPFANKLRRSSEVPTGLNTDFYMKSMADDSVLLTEKTRSFEPNPLGQEGWNALRRSLFADKDDGRVVELDKPSSLKFFRQDDHGYTASLLKDRFCYRDRDDVKSDCGETSAQDLYLVTNNFEPLLGDFGLGRTEHGSGYIAPEWKVVTDTTISHNIDILPVPDDTDINQDPHSPHEIHIDKKEDLRNAIRTFEEGWRTMAMMSDASLALGAQAIATVLSNVLTNTSSSSTSSASVGSAVGLGLGLTLGGIAMRGKRRALSVLMTKLGAAATASGILLSLGSHLPPAAACTVGPLAFLIMVVAVALT